MLRGYRGVIFAAVGGLIALVAIWQLSAYSQREIYDPIERKYPRERYQPSRDTSYPIPTKQHPPTEGYDPHCDQPQSRDDSDLCAQWGAVRAVNETNRLTKIALRLGYIGFWVAAFGGLIGIVGTALLVRTFQENKRAADAAHDANRPWLEIILDGVENFNVSPGGLHSFAVRVKLANRGNSPATNAMVHLALSAERADRRPMDLRKAIRDVEAVFDSWRGHEKTVGSTIFPGEGEPQRYGTTISKEDIEALLGDDPCQLLYLLAVGVRYRFGDQGGRTVASYFVFLSTGNIDYAKGQSIPHQFVRLDDSYSGYAK